MKLTRNERGFTLIELMVVLIIIGILAAIAIPVMSSQTDKAKKKRAVAELKSMKTIVDIYISDSNVNPSAVVPLATADATKGIKAVLTAGGVNVFKDPWGSGYCYSADTTTTYHLYSNGPTGAGNDIFVTESANPSESAWPGAATDWNIDTNLVKG